MYSSRVPTQCVCGNALAGRLPKTTPCSTTHRSSSCHASSKPTAYLLFTALQCRFPCRSEFPPVSVQRCRPVSSSNLHDVNPTQTSNACHGTPARKAFQDPCSLVGMGISSVSFTQTLQSIFFLRLDGHTESASTQQHQQPAPSPSLHPHHLQANLQVRRLHES